MGRGEGEIQPSQARHPQGARIFSARRATRQEQKDYEEGIDIHS
jgi:hypothetical protein